MLDSRRRRVPACVVDVARHSRVGARDPARSRREAGDARNAGAETAAGAEGSRASRRRIVESRGSPAGRNAVGNFPGAGPEWRRPRQGDGERQGRSEEHTSELQSHVNLVCRLLLEKKKKMTQANA